MAYRRDDENKTKKYRCSGKITKNRRKMVKFDRMKRRKRQRTEISFFIVGLVWRSTERIEQRKENKKRQKMKRINMRFCGIQLVIHFSYLVLSYSFLHCCSDSDIILNGITDDSRSTYAVKIGWLRSLNLILQHNCLHMILLRIFFYLIFF